MATRDDPSPDLLDRIRGIASRLVRDAEPHHPDGGTAQSIVDAAARGLAGQLERWGRNPNLGRLLGGVHRDVMAGPGEPVGVSASLGVSAPLAAKARFYVGAQMAAEVAAGGRTEVHAVVEAPGEGVHPLRVEVDAGGRKLTADLAGQRVIHVAAQRPVALVDAGLVLPQADGTGPSASLLQALQSLHREMFDLAYFDAHPDDRYSLIYQELLRRELPMGAILAHPAGSEDLRSTDVDVLDFLSSTVIRRLRAKGVPVTTILTEEPGRKPPSGVDHLAVTTPAAALAQVRAGSLDTERQYARDLIQRRNAASRLDWHLDQLTDSRRVGGNTFEAELDNERARCRLFEAIEGATTSIHVQVYIVRASTFTDHLIVRLIRRARAGVRVRMMVDALYSEQEVLGRLNESIQSLKNEPNIDVIAVNPIESREHFTFTRLKKRDHRKLVVIDGARAFVTGRNASDEYYTGFAEVPVHDETRHERIPWLDAHVEVAGPLVRQIQETFVGTWTQQGGGDVPRDEACFPALSPVGEGTGRLVVHHGLADMNGLAMYEAMFDAARSHVYIVNDFPFVPAIERSLYRLLSRDVQVTLLTGNAAARRDDGTFFPAPLHRTLFEYMVKARLEPLIEAGLEAYEFVPPPSQLVVARGSRIRPYVHAKVVSVDGRVASIGSANLDATASYWESEANVVIHDDSFAGRLEAQLQSMVDSSCRLDVESEYWKRERAQRAVVAKLWPGTLYS